MRGVQGVFGVCGSIMVMLLLLLMLAVGSLAAVWGFVMCFLPSRFERLNNVGFLSDWTVPPPHVQRFIRPVQRMAGLIICGGGCWFSYVALRSLAVLLMSR